MVSRASPRSPRSTRSRADPVSAEDVIILAPQTERIGVPAGVAALNAGFTVTTDQAARIAATRTPIWITRGSSDPVLPVTNGRTSSQQLREAYVAAGVDPAKAADLVRFTEFGDQAYSQPDYHAVVGPTYETRSILHWLLEQ